MAMEFDSIWDEGFFSMLSEDLDYEFDENDLFKNPSEGPIPDNLQGAMKKEDYRELSSFLPNSGKEPVYNASYSLENKFASMDATSCASFTQDSANVTTTSDASHRFADRGNLVKTEINRRNSIDSDIVNREKKSKSSHEPLNIKTETNQNKHASSVHSSHNKQRSKVRKSKTSGAEKIKRVGCDRSSLNRKCKTEKIQIKVEPHSARQKGIGSLKLQPTVTSDTEKENVDIKQSYLKPKTEKLDAKKGFPQAPGEQSISIVKRENGYTANIKVESTWREYPLHPKLVLNRLPDYILHGLSVCTEFFSPKEEVLDQKSNLRLNPLHLPKARIVLRNLSKDDLRCSERFLNRVKSEVNATVARKLKSRGKAREKNVIQRFCCKCKSLQVDRDALWKTKFCDNCGYQLIYLCFKCNEKHYVDYKHAFRHLKICRGSGETKSFGLDSIVLHRCTECTFKTTYTKVMAIHVKTKGHKVDGELDIQKVLEEEVVRVKREGRSKDGRSKGKGKKREVKGDKPEVSGMPKLPRSQYADLIINQNKTSVADVTERFCIKCNKPRSSKTRKLPEPCDKCNARLRLRCLKCQQKSISYDAMLKHLRSMCCPNSYRCAKCNHEGSTWTMMQQHVWEKHRYVSNRPSRREKRRKEIFHCELCNFETNYKYSLGRHMKVMHKK